MTVNHLMLFLHVCGVTLWVGGMAFAWACLRPAAAGLAPAARLELWRGVLARFFPLVWVSIALIALSGGYRLFEVGFASAPRAWHAMLFTGNLMMAVFLSIWFGPWQRLRAAVDAEDWATAALALGRIRQRVGFNLALGVLTIAVSTLGLGI
ncbi:hypothetical protein E6C76_04955 [Pseudothauera nasutitermitis]|uniref:Copper resistance protein D domain-containing protein n=1 Tax=Pseudothauera nasutitermitis TaxID=2565930 RepID=A0A4S4B390_9RHOO|nr:CopD family protein [Pseudothauera nasutitermitis]THF66210.1 hypothetical protein E6C76_04955 [Pseudothauera nasutitermitis]